MAKVNSRVRTLDLVCNLAAPVVAGQFFAFLSYFTTTIIIGIWSAVSVIIELLLLRHIYSTNHELQNKNIDITDDVQEEQNALITKKDTLWVSG